VIFKKPPGIGTNGTKVFDSSIRALAADFGMTDVHIDKHGGSVMENVRRGQNLAPAWTNIPHAAPGWSQTPNAQAPIVNPQATIGASVQGENALSGLKIPAPRPLIDPKLVYRPKTLPEAPE
jgi:hypothetical protein